MLLATSCTHWRAWRNTYVKSYVRTTTTTTTTTTNTTPTQHTQHTPTRTQNNTHKHSTQGTCTQLCRRSQHRRLTQLSCPKRVVTRTFHSAASALFVRGASVRYRLSSAPVTLPIGVLSVFFFLMMTQLPQHGSVATEKRDYVRVSRTYSFVNSRVTWPPGGTITRLPISDALLWRCGAHCSHTCVQNGLLGFAMDYGDVATPTCPEPSRCQDPATVAFNNLDQ